MSIINILSPHTADLIAAGEVVERPASVVKELCENAIDAGAKNISIDISGGGMGHIRVTDDGCGMSPEDAGIAFLRHATSKISDGSSLDSIKTLGFRGEALAAISAVSKVSLQTRREADDVGTAMELVAGEIESMGPVGCAVGTSICINSLFYNTPARLKFMKSDKAEGSACLAAALRCAMGHPEASIRMTRDGTELFFTPGDGTAKSAVYSLLGRDIAMNMLEVRGESDGISVSGFVGAPHACRGNRTMQFFFVNGRAFRSVMLQTALESAYKNSMLVGRFPSCALYLSLDFAKVDVNVHPTKQEVKFSEEKKIFDAVYYAVKSALSMQSKTAEISLSGTTQKAVSKDSGFYKSMTSAEFRAASEQGKGTDFSLRQVPPAYSASRPVSASTVGIMPSIPEASPPLRGIPISPDSAWDAELIAQAEQSQNLSETKTEESRAENAQESIFPSSQDEKPSGDASAQEAFNGAQAPCLSVQEEAPEKMQEAFDAAAQEPTISEQFSERAFRVVGEAMSVYIIVDMGDEMLLIDKHAAHERMIFDALIAQEGEIMSQQLLIPETFRPDESVLNFLSENEDELRACGYEFDIFAGGSVVLRSIPADTEGSGAAALEEIAAKLHRGGKNDLRHEILHTVACKAAIKAGKSSQPSELERIAKAVLSGKVRYCPHGRPVSVSLTKKELDKQFKRIV